MKSQFAGLQRRTGAGRDSVDHGVGGHDDLSNSAAGAIVLALAGTIKGRLGLLDWIRQAEPEIESGVRNEWGERVRKPEPAPAPALVKVDNYATQKLAVKPGPCPNCQSKATQRVGAPGNIHCNQCAVDFSDSGEVVNRPVSTECGCGNPLIVSLSGRKHCNSCGWDSPLSPAQPTNGATFQQLRARRGFMLNGAGERFPWDGPRF